MECHESEIKRSGCAPLSRELATCVHALVPLVTARNTRQKQNEPTQQHCLPFTRDQRPVYGNCQDVRKLIGYKFAVCGGPPAGARMAFSRAYRHESSVHAYLGTCSYLGETWSINEYNELRTEGVFFEPKGVSANLREVLESFKLNYAYK
ncbi:hypothetical protein K0M31_001142 [Melipona bicolor]|uniref:Uncharacterized protein n=1 Tax=Melipona bicolor TaxID=60889 RepID=A0AA40KXF8_9HYME|nr:hypothetical protein K0M31_001142 [Melipona bicolor]